MALKKESVHAWASWMLCPHPPTSTPTPPPVLPAGTVALIGQCLLPLTLFITEKHLSHGSHLLVKYLTGLCSVCLSI